MIGRCLDSVAALGSVTVVDSGSTDATVEIARSKGAQVLIHPWEGYAAQKNWALDVVVDEADWILFLDADEWLSSHLQDEIRSIVDGGRPVDAPACGMPRRLVFLGRVMKYGTWYPDVQIRLVRAHHGRFDDRRVHEHLLTDGPPVMLTGDLMHAPSDTMTEYIEKHARYAVLEATQLATNTSRVGLPLTSWFGRRQWLKRNIWFRLRCRPVIRWFWLLIIKQGWREGRVGFHYATIIALYDYMIDLAVAFPDWAAPRRDQSPQRTGIAAPLESQSDSAHSM